MSYQTSKQTNTFQVPNHKGYHLIIFTCFSDDSPGPERVGLPGDMGAAHNQFQEEEKDSEEGKCGCEWGSDGRGG